MDKTLVFIKKWGVTGCLFLGLVWMNVRLNDIESRLYDCYEKRVLHVYKDTSINNTPLLAILPTKQKIKKL